MGDMPRPRKPHIHREITRHKKVIWYYRKGKGQRIRLPGVFGSKEFNEAYDAAANGGTVTPRTQAPKSTLRWLVDQYYASGRYSNLRPNTQRNQRLILEDVCETGGDLTYSLITSADVRAGIVRREGTPHMAIAYLSIMRALFAFAIDSNWMARNPADSLSTKPVKNDGYHTWTVEEVGKYQERHPIGTQARLALDIMLYTGLRRSDAILLGKPHIKNGIINIRAGKNRAEITLPVLSPLADSIAKTPVGDVIFLFNRHKKPWKNISFGYWFAARCGEAGVPGRAHGLRKAGATIAANNGATPFELTAMFGWSSVKMAEVYTKKADRVRLAERAANKLFPNPTERCGRDGKISQPKQALKKR